MIGSLLGYRTVCFPCMLAVQYMRKATEERRAHLGSQFEGTQSCVAGRPGSRSVRRLCNTSVIRNGVPMPHFLLYIHPRPSAHRIVLPRFMVSLPTFVLNCFEIPQDSSRVSCPRWFQIPSS